MSRGDASDLLCRARREELSADEHRRLEELLDSSAEARLMAAMLSEFERESQVRAGDDLLLARINARAVRKSSGGFASSFGRRLSLRRSRLALALAAAMLLVGSLAFGWRLTTRQAAPSAAPAPAPSLDVLETPPKKARAIARRREPAKPVEAAPELDADEATLPELVAPAPSARRSVPHAQQAVLDTRVNESGELFAKANLLRRQGGDDEAVRLYQRLVTEYPRSRETAPARLALGKLLREKEPARALLQFRALAEQRGPLRPEALWGIAEASRSLGQVGAESRALEDLVREFPNSPYADAARARIADGAR